MVVLLATVVKQCVTLADVWKKSNGCVLQEARKCQVIFTATPSEADGLEKSMNQCSDVVREPT